MTIQAQILDLMRELTRRLNVALTIITHSLPRHPYTLALLRSVPRLDRPRQARLDPVEGQPPDLTRLDPGCSFRPRYRFAVADCALTQPPLEPAGDANTWRPVFAVARSRSRLQRHRRSRQ